MRLSDEQFREAFKPIQIPAAYDAAETKQDKVIYVLAQLGAATADQVNARLNELEPGLMTDDTQFTAEHILRSLFERGLVKGHEEDGERVYDLSKITHANDGEVDPERLAPGLD